MRRRNGEKGAALTFALLLLLLASTLGLTMLERGQALAASTHDDHAYLRAFYAAEGGLAWARHALARDPEYKGGTIKVGACQVVLTVKRLKSVWKEWEVRATAQPGGATVVAVFRPLDPMPALISWREASRS